MQNNWSTSLRLHFCHMPDFFAVQRGGGAWPKWPNGKYAYADSVKCWPCWYVEVLLRGDDLLSCHCRSRLSAEHDHLLSLTHAQWRQWRGMDFRWRADCASARQRCVDPGVEEWILARHRRRRLPCSHSQSPSTSPVTFPLPPQEASQCQGYRLFQGRLEVTLVHAYPQPSWYQTGQF